MDEALDGDYQTYKSRDGAFVREHFFGTYPELRAMVADMSDEEVWALNRGGHDPRKVYAAYAAASSTRGQPTVILAKTIKGYGMGVGRRGPEHHPPAEEDDRGGAARLPRPLRAAAHRRAGAAAGVLYMPAPDSPEMSYLRERRAALGGALPSRRRRAGAPRRCRRCRAFQSPARRHRRARRSRRRWPSCGCSPRSCATSSSAQRIVPIVPDESRTFGMEGMFRQLGIFSPGRPALPARGRRAADVLPGGQARPDPAGGHQRARRVLLVDRRRDLLHQPRDCR